MNLNINTYAHKAIVFPVSQDRHVSNVFHDICKQSNIDYRQNYPLIHSNTKPGELSCIIVNGKYLIFLFFDDTNKDTAYATIRNAFTNLVIMTSDMRFNTIHIPSMFSQWLSESDHFTLKDYYYKNSSKYIQHI